MRALRLLGFAAFTVAVAIVTDVALALLAWGPFPLEPLRSDIQVSPGATIELWALLWLPLSAALVIAVKLAWDRRAARRRPMR